MSIDTIETDVFICGGGPVGLLTAYLLGRMGVKTCIIERYDKAKHEGKYGHAAAIFPRTLEMLGQVELLDEILQTAFLSRGASSYKDGQRTPGKGPSPLYKHMAMYETYLAYETFIRQMYVEDILTKGYERFGAQTMVGWTLQDFTIDSNATDDFKIRATIQDVNTGVTRTVRSKKLVGADGSQSTVRQLAGIASGADESENPLKWVRIDAVIKTDMPDARKGIVMLDSKTHGSVLYVCMDHGRTRIGYAVSQQTLDKYSGHFTEEVAKQEAALAMAPFSLEFVSVDWWTLYYIKHKVASHFASHDNAVFLAGDACHTHSSGAGQGMNTGLSDAFNLSWKLGGVLRGFYDPTILDTYESERKPVAENLIKIDKRLSALTNGDIPPELKNRGADAATLLAETFDASASHLVGLGIKYEHNAINKTAETGMLSPGQREPDAPLHKPGQPFPVRLLEVTKNTGAFWIIVFAGQPYATQTQLRSFRAYINGQTSFTRTAHPDALKFMTVISGNGASPDETLGTERFGQAYWDRDGTAHVRYGISEHSGAVVVLRPDGYFAFATTLDRGEKLGKYFDGVLRIVVDP